MRWCNAKWRIFIYIYTYAFKTWCNLTTNKTSFDMTTCCVPWNSYYMILLTLPTNIISPKKIWNASNIFMYSASFCCSNCCSCWSCWTFVEISATCRLKGQDHKGDGRRWEPIEKNIYMYYIYMYYIYICKYIHTHTFHVGFYHFRVKSILAFFTSCEQLFW